MQENIILIGMAGCGKSTIGVLLAKTLGREFIDTDLIIQRREGQLLQEIINKRGLAAFREAEEAALLSVDASRTVIATGGSAIFCPDGMTHLRRGGKCVFLRLPYEEIERRVKNIATRGIAISPGKTLRDAFDERAPLYEKWADVIVDGVRDMEATLAAVAAAIR